MKKNLNIDADYLESIIESSALKDKKSDIYRFIRVFSTLTYNEQEIFVDKYLDAKTTTTKTETKNELSNAVKEVMRLTKSTTDNIPVFDPRAFGSIGYKPSFNNKKY